jgi:hypothetical protein
MPQRPSSRLLIRIIPARVILVAIPLLAAASVCCAAPPSPAATAAFNTYIATVESRLARQHQSPADFLSPTTSETLKRGGIVIDKLTPSPAPDLPGAMLHHWRGTAFVAGAHLADFETLMNNVTAYPHYFSPQVLQAKVLSRQADHQLISMRVSQRHVITVVMDTTYDVVFSRLDPEHGSSISRSTRITEIASPGSGSEHPLAPAEEHGFLWRQNTYWSYEERDGGLYIQIESVSLTRSIPAGLGWAIGPYVQSVPRDSLEFTLRSVCNALRH